MTGEKLRGVAESTLVLILARVMAVFGVPIALGILGFAATQFLAIKEGMADIETSVAKLETALVIGIAPRVDRLEEDARDLRSELRIGTANRFDKQDGRELEKRIQREIHRVETQLRDLRGAGG